VGLDVGIPKRQDGPVEMIRALRVARRSAMKARIQAGNQLLGLLTRAPEELRARLWKAARPQPGPGGPAVGAGRWGTGMCHRYLKPTDKSFS
jgi:hypothetical protein